MINRTHPKAHFLSFYFLVVWVRSLFLSNPFPYLRSQVFLLHPTWKRKAVEGFLGTRLRHHVYDLCACTPSREWFPSACLSTQNDNDWWLSLLSPNFVFSCFVVPGILAGRACLVKTYSIIQASKVGLCSNIVRLHYHTLRLSFKWFHERFSWWHQYFFISSTL